MSNIHKGSSFEDFLKEEEVLDEIDALATKQIIALSKVQYIIFWILKRLQSFDDC